MTTQQAILQQLTTRKTLWQLKAALGVSTKQDSDDFYCTLVELISVQVVKVVVTGAGETAFIV